MVNSSLPCSLLSDPFLFLIDRRRRPRVPVAAHASLVEDPGPSPGRAVLTQFAPVVNVQLLVKAVPLTVPANLT